jgi:hypothetical protein
MAQNLDTSVAATTASSVFVIGSSADDTLPSEAYWLMRDLIYENRYNVTIQEIITPDAVVPTNSISFTRYPINYFARVRSDACGMTFTVTPPGFGAFTAANSYAGNTAITPLPGMAVTYWDSIQANFGIENTAVYTQVTGQDVPFMIKYMNYMKGNDATRTQYELAGLFQWNTFDWAGGSFGAQANAANVAPVASNANPTATLGWCSYLCNETAFSQQLITQPYGVGTPAGMPQPNSGLIGAAGPARQLECGFWRDPEMQRYRTMFYGNINTTAINYLMKMGILSSVYETPVVVPPIQQRLQLNFPYANQFRPRYINTPQTTPIANAAANAVNSNLIDLQPQATYAGIVPNAGLFYYFYELVKFRSDIDASIIVTWKDNWGINDNFVAYDWYMQGNITQSQIQLNVVQQGNYCGYRACLAFRMAYPWTNLTRTTIPQQNTLCPYTFADVQVQNIRAQFTTPTGYIQEKILWNNGSVEPNSWDTPSILAFTRRGVLDLYTSWFENLLRAQFFTIPTYDDVTYQRNTSNTWGDIQSISSGYFNNANYPATTIYYGSHSFYAGTNNKAYQQGLHNQFTNFVFAPIGIDDDHLDLGSTSGSLRYEIVWANAPASAVEVHHLMAYRINICYIGTGNATTSMPIR